MTDKTSEYTKNDKGEEKNMDIEKKQWETLYSEEQIRERIAEMGKQISEEYKEKKLLVVSLLRGSFIFAADLVRAISIPCKIDFMTASSYGHSTETTGKVKVVADISSEIEGYDVIIVDDIMDSGITMNFVKEHLAAKNPVSVKSCVLLDKPDRRQVGIVPDYCGFVIEDKFVVGYGLNYGDYYRNVPYVFAVSDKDR